MAKKVGESPTTEAQIMAAPKLEKLDKFLTAREKEIAGQRQAMGDAIVKAEADSNCNKWALRVYRQLMKRPEQAIDRWAHLSAYVEGSGILEPDQADIETKEERKSRARKVADDNITKFPAA